MAKLDSGDAEYRKGVGGVTVEIFWSGGMECSRACVRERNVVDV